MKLFNFVFKFPPTTNNAYFVGRGRKVLTTTGRNYKLGVQKELMAAGSTIFFNETERIAIELIFFPPDRRRRDLANFEKLLLDSMSGLVFADDSQIDRLLLTRGRVKPPRGAVLATIRRWEITPPEWPK